MNNFHPNMKINKITNIDLEYLWSLGIRGLIFDLDNTITPWHLYKPDPEIIAWFFELRKRGFLTCILSNSLPHKVRIVQEWLKVPILANSKKPTKIGFKHAIEYFELPKNQIAMIGDQLLTDIYGGNRLGLFTILTEKIDEKEYWGTKYISRRIEKIIYKILKISNKKSC